MKKEYFQNVLIRFCLACLIASLPFMSHAQTSDEQAIREILKKQTEGWNQGNIEKYMKTYWQSDSLIFVGKKGLTYGYKNTLENYKKSYPDTATMGKLQLDLLQIKRLSSTYYYVTGKWSLKRTVGDLHGYFTLLLQKIMNKWVIISDHSS